MILHGVSIHTGGGKVLLDHLLAHDTFGKITHLICDQRYELPKNHFHGLNVYRVSPTIVSRIKAEFFLKKIARENPDDMIICFSNLPPLFRHANKVILFFQNALLLPDQKVYASSLKIKVRILFERIWLHFFIKNISETWVQTKWMKESFEKFFNCSVAVRPIELKLPARKSLDKEWDFISVTGSAPHKHLKELLEAWKLISLPSLKLLIISDTPTSEISRILGDVIYKNITFKTNVSRDEIFQFYQMSRALILTSSLESYCLPLYEARHFGLKIIAPKVKYVEEVSSPDEYIYRLDPKEILNAILRFNLNKIEL